MFKVLVILPYLVITAMDIILMGKNKSKRKIAVYLIIMLIPLVLSVSLVSDVKFISISTAISHIVSKVVELK